MQALNLAIYQSSLFTLTVPGATSPTAAARMELRDNGGNVLLALTTGGHGIVNDGAGNFVVTILPSQSLAIATTPNAGPTDIFNDPSGVADDSSTCIAAGVWHLTKNVTDAAPTPQPNPIPAPAIGNTLAWNGTAWAPGPLNLAGGANEVTGALPLANLAQSGAKSTHRLGWNGTAWAPARPDPYVIDLVLDCGADPTGATDTSAAWNAAFAIAKTIGSDSRSVSQSVTIYVPPGLYLLTTPVSSQPAVGQITRLIIQGSGDASVVLINVGGNIAIDLLNWSLCGVRDLSFQGVQNNNSVPDCWYVLRVDAVTRGWVLGCHFSWINFGSGGCIWCNQGALNVERCWIGGCGGGNLAGGASVLGQSCALAVRDCHFSDFPGINGSSPSNIKGGNQIQISYQGSSTQMQWMGLQVVGCFVDEANSGSVKVVGNGATVVPHVYLRDNQMLAPQAGADGVSISNTTLVEIDGHTVQAISGSGGHAVRLVSVSTAKIRALLVDSALNTNTLSADAACGEVEIVESESLLPANIASSALVTTKRHAGVLADIRSTGAAVTANQLVKMTATGVQTLGTADATNLLYGVTQDTAAGSGINVRVARPGQRITVLSDGATTIAVGDQITNSAATAGEVKKGTSNVIGVALSAATNVAGTAFDMMFL